jgi:hypothetical protein
VNDRYISGVVVAVSMRGPKKRNDPDPPPQAAIRAAFVLAAFL